MKDFKTQALKKDKSLILTQTFEAPVELLFEVWSDCKHLKHWWGPKNWPMDECEIDFQEGGHWRYCLRGPNKEDESWGMAIYHEIKKPVRIVYKDHFTDAGGKILENLPKLIIKVDFVGQNGQTNQIITVDFDSNEERDKIVEMGMTEGMSSSMERLDVYLGKITSAH